MCVLCYYYNNNWERLSLEPNFRRFPVLPGLPECLFLGTTSDFWTFEFSCLFTFELNKLDNKLGDDEVDDLLEDVEASDSSNSKLRDWATGNSTPLTRLPCFFLR